MKNSSGNIKIAKNTIALYIRMGITMIISFITTRITLEVLGVEDYGLNNVVASVVTLLSFINASMGTAVQRFYSVEIGKKNEAALANIFKTGLYLHLIIAGITLLIAEIFAIFFLSSLNIPPERIFAAQFVFQVSIVSMILNIINVPYSAFLRAQEEFSKIAVLDIIRAFLRLVVLFFLIRINYDKLIVLSILTFGVTLFYVLSLTYLANKYEAVSFTISRDKELIKKMLNFISMLIFTVLSSIANKQGIVILVNLFFGLTINAAYAIAVQVLRIIETFAMNFKQSVVPQLMSAFGANDTTRMNKLIYGGTKVTYLLMALITIPLIFETDFILELWLKEPPTNAATFAKLILIFANIDTFSFFVYSAVHASGNIKRQQILTSLSYIFSVSIILLAFEFGGNFYYAVYVPIVFSIIRNLIIILSAKIAIQLDVMFYLLHVVGRSLMHAAILVAITFGIVQFLEVSFIRLFTVIVVTALLTFLGGYIIVFNPAERVVLKSYYLSVQNKILPGRKS